MPQQSPFVPVMYKALSTVKKLETRITLENCIECHLLYSIQVFTAVIDRKSDWPAMSSLDTKTSQLHETVLQLIKLCCVTTITYICLDLRKWC